MSTTIALALIGTYYSVNRGVFELITIPMFILSLILFLGAIFERNESYYPFYGELIRKYSIQ
jgi:hypothetical protein